MTGEGVFPKIDGDIYFATEANRAAGASKLWGGGSLALITSGTNFQPIGSVVIPAGSLTTPFFLRTFGEYDNNVKLMIEISGTSNNANVVLADRTVAKHWIGEAFLGSPINLGWFRVQYWNSSDFTQFISGVQLNNIDTTKAVCVNYYATCSGPNPASNPRYIVTTQNVTI